VLPLFGGCGIYSFSGGKIPGKTVSVALFDNDAEIVVPSLAQSFSEALKDRFISQTNLRLVQRDGDVSFSGAITSYRISPVAIQGNETAAQNRLTITVKVDYVNNVDAEQGWSESFSQWGDFSSSESLSSVEATLIEDINAKLTTDIFNKVASNW
jgi:hypothetical protein